MYIGEYSVRLDLLFFATPWTIHDQSATFKVCCHQFCRTVKRVVTALNPHTGI